MGFTTACHCACNVPLVDYNFQPEGKITVYLMDGTARYAELLAKLGKHTSSGYCVYIRRLSDVELPVLEQIVRESYEYIKSLDGHIDRILWKTAKQ